MSRLAPVLMVQGTASSVGKSAVVAGLCRLFHRRGLSVAPFKAQNMSNNAAVCADGGEIGRAQFSQALAAGIEPTVHMNPILLKPQGDRSAQVVVRGRMEGTRTAADYFSGRRERYWPVVRESLDLVRREFDLVLAEGAGSPAEINLRERDVVNMRVALHAGADVLVVADVDRGGAFASLLGTWEWLAPAERALVRGFVLNRFRGDAALLAPAPELLEARTGVPVLGVVPHLPDLALPEEDAASLAHGAHGSEQVEIAVVRLPHVANFDELGPLAKEPGVSLRYVQQPHELRAPDLVVLPGTKATLPDLAWLRERGLDQRIEWLAEHGTPVLGICGGFQLLGTRISDPLGLESTTGEAEGLCLLDIMTELTPEKRTERVHGTFSAIAGVWAALDGEPAAGYEIHVGRSHGRAMKRPLVRLASGPDGAVSPDGVVAGTYVHGLFEEREARLRLLSALARGRGLEWSAGAPRADPYDALADALERSVRLDGLPSLAAVGMSGATLTRR